MIRNDRVQLHEAENFTTGNGTAAILAPLFLYEEKKPGAGG